MMSSLLPSVTLPPAEAAKLRAGCLEALQMFASPVHGQAGWEPLDDAPELIVVLLRAAEAPFRALQALAAAQGVQLPPAIRAHIGGELQSRYLADGGSLPPWPLYLLDEEEQAEIAQPFEVWLRADPYAQSVVSGMQADAEAHQLIPERMLVVDDCTFEGGTKLAARALVRRAFELVDEPAFAFLGGSELPSAVRAAVADQPFARGGASTAVAFFHSLGKGHVETPTSCVRITSAKHLAEVGKLVAAEASASARNASKPKRGNPYPMLRAMYGDDALLGFFEERVVRACVDAVLRHGDHEQP